MASSGRAENVAETAVPEKVGVIETARDFLERRAGKATPNDMLKYLRKAGRALPADIRSAVTSRQKPDCSGHHSMGHALVLESMSKLWFRISLETGP